MTSCVLQLLHAHLSTALRWWMLLRCTAGNPRRPVDSLMTTTHASAGEGGGLGCSHRLSERRRKFANEELRLEESDLRSHVRSHFTTTCCTKLQSVTTHEHVAQNSDHVRCMHCARWPRKPEQSVPRRALGCPPLLICCVRQLLCSNVARWGKLCSRFGFATVLTGAACVATGFAYSAWSAAT